MGMIFILDAPDEGHRMGTLWDVLLFIYIIRLYKQRLG